MVGRTKPVILAGGGRAARKSLCSKGLRRFAFSAFVLVFLALPPIIGA